MIDLQTYLDNAVKASRAKTLAQSDQMTLGEMILKMEAIIKAHAAKDTKPEYEATVRYDFEYYYPSSIDSWRGSYAELALNIDHHDKQGHDKELSAVEFYELLSGAVGKTYGGYKGGDFTMSRQTPVWVANYGNSGNTAVIDIVDANYSILIITGYREF
jgi:hypothetical protein